jgi:hypothetical protein
LAESGKFLLVWFLLSFAQFLLVVAAILHEESQCLWNFSYVIDLPQEYPEEIHFLQSKLKIKK